MNHSLLYYIILVIAAAPLMGDPGDFVKHPACESERRTDNALEEDCVGMRSCDADSPFDDEADNSCGVSCCECSQDTWDLWAFDNYIFVGYTGGRGLSYRHGYASAGIFFTPSYFANSCVVPFLDVRGYVFDDGKGAANVGLGSRYILSSWNAVVGINAYYDYRKSRRYDYNQIGIGFEWLTPLCDFRLNGYFPVGSYNHRKGTLYDFGDNIFLVNFEWEQAYKGVDAELGVWVLHKTPCNWFGLYLAAGPYYYTRDHRRHTVDDDHRQIKGAQGRILAKINDYVDVSVSGTYDNFYRGTVQGQIMLTLPLDLLCGCKLDDCCCKTLPCLWRQIATQPVNRNGIIVADQDPKCTSRWNWSGGCCSECDARYSCPSSGSGSYSGSGRRSGEPRSRSWHSDYFSSDFFPYP